VKSWKQAPGGFSPPSEALTGRRSARTLGLRARGVRAPFLVTKRTEEPCFSFSFQTEVGELLKQQSGARD
jgi:hypothetical protein